MAGMGGTRRWRPALGSVLALVFCAGLARAPVASAERIMDLASVAGVRSNQLIGYGLVVGLDGTGDQTGQTPFTVQSLESMLKRFGVTVPSNVNPQLKNVAAVTVDASLPPFAKPGQTITVTVSTIGNATSLRGGTLILTPLMGADGRVYAMAQGNLVVGGVGASSNGNSVKVNIPTAGTIPNGATVERAAPTTLGSGNYVWLNLHHPDFTTAKRVADAINRLFGPGTAEPGDAMSVRVLAPRAAGQRVDFVSVLQNIQVTPGEAPARVIINSRTGTVVINQNVTVSPAAVAHGNLSVTISNTTQVSQPAPLAGGSTTVVPNSQINVRQEKKNMFVFSPGVSLDDIVRAINRVGASPGDLIAILEALKAAGALHAQLIVI